MNTVADDDPRLAAMKLALLNGYPGLTGEMINSIAVTAVMTLCPGPPVPDKPSLAGKLARCLMTDGRDKPRPPPARPYTVRTDDGPGRSRLAQGTGVEAMTDDIGPTILPYPADHWPDPSPPDEHLSWPIVGDFTCMLPDGTISTVFIRMTPAGDYATDPGPDVSGCGSVEFKATMRADLEVKRREIIT